MRTARPRCPCVSSASRWRCVATGGVQIGKAQRCLFSLDSRRSVSSLRTRWRLFRLRYPASGSGTTGLIGVNVLVWGLYNAAPEASRRSLWSRWAEGSSTSPSFKAWVPAKDFWERHFFATWNDVVRHRRLEMIPLCTFMHADGYHLLFNMVSLFFFGRQLEHVLGSSRYLSFYLLSGTTAAAAQVGSCNSGHDRFVPVMGASGGVYALMAFTTCCIPRQIVYLYMVVPVPLWLLMAGLVAADLFLVRPDEGHVGHLAGAACGATLFLVRYGRWR